MNVEELNMPERELLMVPGPSIVDPEVLRATSRSTESHLHRPFAEKLGVVLENLKKLFVTEGEVFAIAGSGTLAQEVGLANVINPGESVLNLVNGFFSGRFVDMAQRLGAKSSKVEVPIGEGIEPEQVKKALQGKNFKAVTCSHVETSSSVAIDVQAIGDVVKDSGAFFIVDSVCSLGGLEVKTDEWNIDMNCSCTQKALGVPPGLALIAASKKALEYVEKRETPTSSFYGDLRGWLNVSKDPIKYYATPPINLIYGLDVGLKNILNEGLANRAARHKKLANAFRNGMKAIGLPLVAKPKFAADTVTSVFYPPGIDDTAFREDVGRLGVIIARGFGPLVGKTFRGGNMGSCTSNDIIATVSAIERTLKKYKYEFGYGLGCKAAQEALD
jgi:alanine-glyoxylate transaminase/serine-glyoxylate transaminase/serine-pyruvate transaminase